MITQKLSIVASQNNRNLNVISLVDFNLSDNTNQMFYRNYIFLIAQFIQLLITEFLFEEVSN